MRLQMSRRPLISDFVIMLEKERKVFLEKVKNFLKFLINLTSY